MDRSRSYALALPSLVLLISSAQACSCGDERPQALADAGGPGGDSGSNVPDFGFDEQGNPIDGGVPGEDGAVADGSATGDGGPLNQPLSEFCSGNGAVVEVGGAGACSGSVAQRTFRFALCTCGSISLQSNLQVDAFDSRLGPYGAVTGTVGPNIFSDGHLGVNSELLAQGMVSVLGSVFVSGGGFSVGQQSSVALNIYSAGDAVQANSRTIVGRNMFVDGNVVGRYDVSGDLYVPSGADVDGRTTARAVIRGPIPQVVPCPCAPGEILDVAAYTAFGALHNDNAVNRVLTSTTWSEGQGADRLVLPCGRYYLTRIIHPRSLTIVAAGRTVLYVDGDLQISGGLRLDLQPGAEIDLFIRGSLTLTAASRLGDQVHPSAVRTYVGGSEPLVLSANTLFGGNLYAPRADVTFGASTDLYGALYANNASFSGSASVHFDRAVRSAGVECTPDAGPADGGGQGADAGLVDAGPADSGPGDSGGAASDAAEGCTQCFGCPGQACLPQPGGASMCGPCGSDLDCCPTEVCEVASGACRPSL